MPSTILSLNKTNQSSKNIEIIIKSQATSTQPDTNNQPSKSMEYSTVKMFPFH
ncbi:hypothetical protein DOY81_004777 [Sarcophaga bullata]|nr:hypothetical protein DOY81_004777 [Sarcophaga bullata]